MPMDEEESSGGAAGTGAADDDAEADVMARFSLDVSAGCGGRHSTLLDEYERLAFEVQLRRAIFLRRCYSEPSPVRFAPAGAPTPMELCGARHGEAEALRQERAAGRLWRLHDVVARWLQALEPVLRWLRSAWARRPTAGQSAARHQPPAVPRVQLLDYLR